MNTAKALVVAIVADGIALAVSFGVDVSQTQQTAILAFVGTVTTAAAAIYAWHESHKLKAKATVAMSTNAPVHAVDAAKQIADA